MYVSVYICLLYSLSVKHGPNIHHWISYHEWRTEIVLRVFVFVTMSPFLFIYHCILKAVLAEKRYLSLLTNGLSS